MRFYGFVGIIWRRMDLLKLLHKIRLENLIKREPFEFRNWFILQLSRNVWRIWILKRRLSMENEWRRNEDVIPFDFGGSNGIGYLDNELFLKENPSAEKPVKKARGGVASRKAKANSMAASAAAARSKGKGPENRPPSSEDQTQMSPPPPPASTIDEEPRRTTTPSKVGDLSFVLNAPSHSPPQS